MADSKEQRQSVEREFRVHFLMRETGITEAQASHLIDQIGYEVDVLLVAARRLNKPLGDQAT
ncbi:MAG: hypothetical protein EOR60_15195 [Mesorhizobium sp.]|nr:MAG: hypothetical protein EOR60_15195 [Mesorhizobium sp.]